MNIDKLAQFYVNVLEPAWHTIAIIVIIIALLSMLNIVRDSSKKGELVNNAFSFIIKMLTKMVTWSGYALLWMAKACLKIIIVIYASIRDFFTSKI